ncbi:thermonuclease family protein [Erythrobacter sp. NE805]|uniref:thermonuclease family protein n=1 Tax=Erythrobacter sp. NE805 TaxID=3389875 RepID=UPI00396B1AD0
MLLSALAAAALAVCPPSGARHQCVVDGDTIWWQGEKIRIAEIDAPELRGRCPREKALAVRAQARLVVLLNAGPVRFERVGTDRYGRTLATFGPIAEQLIAEGLARRWGDRSGWC